MPTGSGTAPASPSTDSFEVGEANSLYTTAARHLEITNTGGTHVLQVSIDGTNFVPVAVGATRTIETDLRTITVKGTGGTTTYTWISSITENAVIANAAADATTKADAALVAAEAYTDTALATAEAYTDNAVAPTFTGTVNTPGNVATTAASWTPPVSSLVAVEASVGGKSASDAKTAKTTATFQVDGGGVVTQVSTASTGDNHHTAGAGAWAQDVNTDGAVIKVVVTGAAATSIDWKVIGDVNILS